MKIAVHDYAGHPFPLDLSRGLAQSGLEVTHIYCKSLPGAKGLMQLTESDHKSLRIVPIDIGKQVSKDCLIKRSLHETLVGKKVRKLLKKIRPDMVISTNAPLQVQRQIFSISDIKKVFWIQDKLGEGTKQILSSRSTFLGITIGNYFLRLERKLILKSDCVVAICDEFADYVNKIRNSSDTCKVIENWAAIDELKFPLCSENKIQQPHSENVSFCYSGTLGWKHDPNSLNRLMTSLKRHGCEGLLTIYSEGICVDWLANQSSTKVNKISIKKFVPFTELAESLQRFDVLVATLEPGAGKYCVPSKILTYMCIGKPIILISDDENLAVRIIKSYKLGFVIPSSETALDDFIKNNIGKLMCKDWRNSTGARARCFAETNFKREKKTEEFMKVINSTLAVSI